MSINFGEEQKQREFNKKQKPYIKHAKSRPKRKGYEQITFIIRNGKIREKILIRTDGKVIHKKRRWKF